MDENGSSATHADLEGLSVPLDELQLCTMTRLSDPLGHGSEGLFSEPRHYFLVKILF